MNLSLFTFRMPIVPFLVHWRLELAEQANSYPWKYCGAGHGSSENDRLMMLLLLALIWEYT